MLVLSRKTNEVIVIGLPDGREISLTVVDIRGDKVRLGVVADSDIAVHRKEVWEAIHKEKEASE